MYSSFIQDERQAYRAALEPIEKAIQEEKKKPVPDKERLLRLKEAICIAPLFNINYNYGGRYPKFF